MMEIWVVTADSSRARILKTRNPFGGLVEIETHEHAKSRLHPREFTTGGPGRASNRTNGAGGHALEKEGAAKDQEAVVFARHLAACLGKAEREGRFGRLVIAAAPRFLGRLRACLPPNVRKRVVREVSKDLVKQNPSQIRGSLPERL
ncbi:MAG: host attachment protein [Akkermansiaceae bacterium]|nr:host attachment protein [Akkermansiaceae bacterium]NNM28944.1 host attachment protein [Akkermansiaceae bacterium]